MSPPISTGEDLASGASSGVATPLLSSLKQTKIPVDVSAFVVDPSLPKPEWAIGLPPPEALEHLSEESRTCVENFASHPPAPQPEWVQLNLRNAQLTDSVGQARTAAVLIAVYQPEGQDGLRVLLTTRAKHLRRNPGETVSSAPPSR